MRMKLVVAIVAAIWITPTLADSVADHWNLADLYPSVAAWSADATTLEAQMSEFAGCKNHLGDSLGRFRKCLDLQADMTKRYARMEIYSSQLLAEDTGAAASLELTQRGDVLGTRLNEATSFVNPEILRLGSKKVGRFLASDVRLKIYRHPLDEILRAAPHTLDAGGESLLAQFGLMSGAGGSTYSMLTNADIPWPKIKLSTGEEVVLNASAYTKYREVENRDDRKRVMDAFFATFKTYERSLGITLYSQLKEDSVYAGARRYPDSITRALDANRIPVAVIDTLIAQTNADLPTLHRYFRLRAKMLGVPQMHYYDIYPPLVHSDTRFPLATAEQLVSEAVAPLGSDYVKAMNAGFANRWMDVYPRPRKQSGAHMAGAAYDVHPYVLMNYNGDYESVTTLAHEWGHAMHSYLTNRAQPFVTSDYAIFIAEIASTFNEKLLLDRMLKAAQSDDERLLYLGSALENLRGTFYRQAMFAEFERKIHAQADKGEPLSGDALTSTYCDILKRYHGAAEGVVAIDDAYCTEWAYIPHFYNSFYVYQYATSIAASSLFADQVGRGEPGALQRYLDLLRAGSSDYPYELVKKSGVDLATPAPYQALVARMNTIMDDIEAILAKRH
jgi:oligoendopeptidase F